MKILLDGCVWAGAAEVLRAAGYEVELTVSWPRDPGDVEILGHAPQNSQVLVTLDKDFGELAVVRKQPHYGILRLVNVAAQEQGLTATAALAKYEHDLRQGGIVTVEPGRVRVRTSEVE